MITLAWPWVLLALPLPWVWRRALRERPGAVRGALRWPHFALLEQALGRHALAARGGTGWPLALAWGLLCLAAARPVSYDTLQSVPRSGRELMLAVDVSRSMAAQDMVIAGREVDRLTAVKAVVGDFLRRRQGDRIGLILFGQQAFLMTPLTFDLPSVRYQLETSAIGIAGPETAIGDAIGLAVKHLRRRQAADRVLVLLTDGVNTAGALGLDEALALARHHRVRIHTIGIGGDGRRRGLFGLMLPSGGAEIDEEALQRIASQTGGRYFRARDSAELAAVYDEIDRLEPVPDAAPPVRLQRERFVVPLALGALLFGFGMGWFGAWIPPPLRRPS
ncbi:MAG: hypothetical protein KatS3mg126_0325 [Lysobacteraceae bacterium]|nr:MAG: hypothetical protein KatS3mg126_0325 [Xanthomonadaceae bacterium]